MSDMSFHWCKRCKQPEYACDCDDDVQELDELSPVRKRLRGIKPWEDAWRLRCLPPDDAA